MRKLLSSLGSMPGFRLAMEDQALYPRPMDASDPEVKSMARQFMAEMEGLGRAFTACNGKWQALASSPQQQCCGKMSVTRP